MRYHVLGVGSIGSLIAFHLKRSLKLQRKLLQPGPSSKSRRDLLLSNLSNQRQPSGQGSIVSSLCLPPYVQTQLPDPQQTSVTLHLRRKAFGKQVKQRYVNSIVVEQDGVRDIEGGFQTDFNSSPTDIIASIVRRNRANQPDDGEAASHDRFLISRTSTGSSSAVASTIRDQTSSKIPLPDHDGGISLISTLEATHSQPRASPIDSLIITTKCDATLSALEGIRHRIHPWSTIVLLQNGMGVLDTLFDTFFKDPEQRPNFVLASTTHGAWRKGPLDVVHASTGTLHFGIVPSGRAGSEGFEAGRVPFGQTINQVKNVELPTRGEAKKAKGWEKFSPDEDSPVVQEEQDPQAPSNKLSIGSIPDQPNLRTLRATVAGLLSLPLNVEWEPIREFQLRSLRKLVINACINPLTALVDCKNGDLFGNPAAMDAIWSICLEAGMVLEAQVREHLSSDSSSQRQKTSATLSVEDLILQSTETGEPMLHPSLTPKALFQEVQRVARATAANWSSMHSDLKNKRGSTEIDYINGYISALGRGYNIDTTANDLLTNLIKLKITKVTGSFNGNFKL
ncbi:related to 2-dehydropantoate 2-reductase [Melanopsichium pennsylvanicum]|uniref:Related to 2-dehydropantoate 2-reductase n=2 Tax=Melanopsichium pennsylvanicum TaxID=63383 RepID=A0AAJ4XKU5_9BASI|nr:related to 2-dehydropantoate 2-reductase [Melanopsichium pennsylvanicum 4]SNX84142.1 related to 2-dehydropantoate 2-reductase [Melanopsichium pennsylvanicum]